MHRLTFMLACLLIGGSAVAAPSPDPKSLVVPKQDHSRAQLLVAKLGSETYSAREEAQEELEKMGRLAYPALIEGMNASPSPEVRFRCRELLPRASKLELQARLETFLADTENKYEHDLPGWNEFRKLAGNTAAARTVFSELMADVDNRNIMMAVSGPPSELGMIVAARKQELYQWRFPRTPNAVRREATAADVITLLFAESHIGSKYVPRGVTVTTLISIPGVSAAINDPGEKGAAYKAVVSRWIESRDDPTSMYQAMTAATTLNLMDSLAIVAAKLLTTQGAPGLYRGMAAMNLARTQSKQHLPILEKLHADESVVTTRFKVVNGQQMRDEIQMRDVSLAASILLTGQNPTDYGFTSTINNQYSYSNWTITDDKRAPALQKWKSWRADNPDFETNKK